MFLLEEDVNLPATLVPVDLFGDNMHFLLAWSSELPAVSFHPPCK